MSNNSTIHPDQEILVELKNLGFDNFHDMAAYAFDREDTYALGLAVPIAKKPKDVLAIIDFLFICTKPTEGKPGKVECVDGRIIRIGEAPKAEISAGLTQWSVNGPFLSKSAVIEKLLYTEKHKISSS